MSALICETCGAPLAAQKARPLCPGKGAKTPSAAPMPAVPYKVSHQPKPNKQAGKPIKSRKPKKRKSLFQKVLSEAFDVIEDIFD